ncbi:MAG: hypothetical protein FJ088_10500, partial [Deltaproteobacteria bacterium]|nr:hypothetical protein [Deltaproteobacteria bacterium]
KVNHGNDLSESFALMGLSAAIVPADSGCGYVFSGVFPDLSADAGSYDSYDFTKIVKLVKPLTKYGIPAIFQAKFGAGKTSCAEINGVVTGSPPDDPSLWADVAFGVLSHLTAGAIQWKPQNLNVKYALFWDDPFGKGGYEKGQFIQAVNDYFTFAKRVKKGLNLLKVGGISTVVNGIESLSGGGDETMRFIGEMASAKSIPFDALVYSSRGATPFEHLGIAKRLKDELDGSGLGGVEMIDAAASINEDVWKSVIFDGIRSRSAYAGACFSVVKILSGGLLALFVPERNSGMKIFDEYGSFKAEDLFFDDKGVMLPAALSFVPFMLAAGEKNMLLEPVMEGGAVSTDGEGIALLAAKSPEGIHMIAAACYPDGEAKLSYNLRFKGAESFKQGKFYRAVVDKYSEDFHYSETGKIVVVNGKFEFVRDIDNYSVQYVKFELAE